MIRPDRFHPRLLSVIACAAVACATLGSPIPCEAQEPPQPPAAGPVTVTGKIVRSEDGGAVAGARIVVSRTGERGGRSRGAGRGGRGGGPPGGGGFPGRRMPLEEVMRTETAADGAFTLADLDPGTYFVEIRADGRALVSGMLTLPLEEPRPLSIELRPGLTLRGTVVAEDGATPIAEARVTCGAAEATTGADGSFVLESLPAGEASYDVSAAKTGWIPSSVRVDRVTPPDHGGVTVMLREGRKTTVRVVDASGTPVADADVALVYLGGGRGGFPEGRTDAEGGCLIGGIEPMRTFLAVVSAEGYPTHRSRPLWIGDRDLQVTVTLAESAGLRGVVVDSEGAPVAGVRVTLIPLLESAAAWNDYDSSDRGPGSAFATTDDSGRFALDGLALGTYRIRVDANGHPIAEGIVETTSGSGGDLTISLLEPGGFERHDDSTQIEWEWSVEEAIAKARAERRPMMVAVAMDFEGVGERAVLEPANEVIARVHFHNPELVELAREFAPVLSSVFDHMPDPDSDEAPLCRRYGAIPCSVHVEAETWVRTVLLGREDIIAPSFVFLDPTMQIVEQRSFWLTDHELMRMMVRCLRVVRPDVAGDLAARRLRGLLGRCASPSSDERRAALADLAVLATVGDEYASTLIQRGVPGLSADETAALLDGLGPGIREVGILVAPYLAHAEPRVVRSAARAFRRSAGSRDLEAMVPNLAAVRDREARDAILLAFGIERRDGHLDFAGARASAAGHRAAIELALAGDADAVEEVASLVASASPEVRRDCALAAARIGGDACLAALAGELLRGGPQAAVMARALGRAGDRRAAPLLVEVLEDASWLLREEAARALGELRATDAGESLRPLLEDAAPPVRAAAAEALYRLGDRSGLTHLASFLEDPVLGERARAVLREAFLAEMPDSPQGWDAWLRARNDERRER